MISTPRLVVSIGLTGEPRREELLRKYRELLRLGGLGERRPALWIAPTHAVVKEVRDRLALAEPGALLDPGVTTFGGFAASVVRDGSQPLRALSTLQRRRLVRQVIARAAAEGALKYFAPVGGSTGLVNLVDETIARLRQRDISAKQYARQQRGGAPRQRELAGLYAAYEQLLGEQGLIDAEGMFRAARDRMTAEPEVATGIRLAVIDGFTEFTAPQLMMLRLLAERAERVVVTLAGEAGEGERRDLFARTIATRRLLVEELGAEIQWEGEAKFVGGVSDPDDGLRAESGEAAPNRGRRPLPQNMPPLQAKSTGGSAGASPSRGWGAMGHLRRNLFRSYRQLEPLADAAVESLDRVAIIAASSVHAEIEEIARRVKSLLVDGEAPSDVLVAFRSTFDVADRVRQAFDDFGIPYYLDASRRLNATPLVRSLLNVLRLEVEDWPYRRVLHGVGDRSIGWWDGSNGEWGRGNGEGSAARGSRGAVEWLVRQGQLPTGREALLEMLGAPVGEGEAPAEPPLELEVKNAAKSKGKREAKSSGGSAGASPSRGQQSLFDDDDDDPFGDEIPTSASTSTGESAPQPSRWLVELDARGFDSGRAAERLRGFAEMLAALPRQATISKWVVAVERLAGSLGLFDEKSAGGAAPLPNPPLQGEGARYKARREWSILAEGLRSAEHVDAWAEVERTKLTLAEFVDLLATTAAELPAPESRETTGRVLVVSAENMRHLRPRRLFVGGLSEQAFPAGRRVAVDEGAEQTDGGDELPADARSDEMLLFFDMVTAATESLTLSYPALDAKAQPLPASPFLVELQRSFENRIEVTRQSLSYEHQHGDVPLSRSDVRRHAVLNAHETKDARTPDVKLLATLTQSPQWGAAGRSILEGIDAVAGRSDRKVFGSFEGVFTTDAARSRLAAQYGPEYIWSPSRLETYAACPFRFFGEHLLKLEALPELALESDLARRGSLLHDTLARLYGRINELAEQGSRATPAEVADNFLAMLQRIVDERPRRGLDRALVEIEKRQIAAWAEQFARQHEEYSAAWPQLDGELRATYFEARFGPKNRRSESTDDAVLSTDEAFELKVGDEPIRFTGQIDRIDVGRVGGVTVFNVIDYKTSALHRVDEAKMRAGTQLQLPLYALAVAELLLAEQEAVGLSAGYWSIRGKGFAAAARSGGPLTLAEVERGVLREAAHWPELKGALLQRIAEIVDGIRQGWFPVYNEDQQCGQFCPLSTGCRIAHVRNLEKVWLPPVGDAT